MIEKEIEANIIAAVKALALPGLDVRGAWQAAAEGDVKGREGAEAAAELFVAVSPRAFETFGGCVASFDVALALKVRVELCADGASLETYAAPLADMVQNWNLNLDCGHPLGLAVEDAFTPGGLQGTGGYGPTFDRDAGSWSIDFRFTLRGVVVAATEGD